LSSRASKHPAPVILGCAGPALLAEERTFFAELDPLGFILFARNCLDPAQTRALVASLRDTVGRADAPILIDQEGGRVSRLKAPHWRHPPPAARFAALYDRDKAIALQAINLNARLIAADLTALGIDVDCAPVLDLPAPGSHEIIGDRALGLTPEPVAALGRAFCEGLLAGGVLPVLKHLPGHGRARVDSHLELPVIEASAADLQAHDFAPFRALKDMPWAMTAHVLCPAFDKQQPASTSKTIIAKVIRGLIGFDGVLISDDVGMEALAGSFRERTKGVLAAGCDLALHCSGKMDEMRQVADGLAAMTPAADKRVRRARGMLRRATKSPSLKGEAGKARREAAFDTAKAARQVDAWLAAA
jgi:beta-N-acetylhexosaminidase